MAAATLDAVTNRERSQRFLAALADIERHLRRSLGADYDRSFSAMVDEAGSRDQAVRRNRLHLKEYWELRNAIVHQRGPNDPEVAEQARTVGADPDLPHLALAAALRAQADPASLVRIRRSLLAHIGHLVEGRILAGTRSSQVLLVVPVSRDTRPVRTAIEGGLAEDPVLRDVVVGSGRRSPDLATVGRSTRQALLAAEVGQALGRWGRIVPYRHVIPEALFLTHPEAGEDLVGHALGPILEDGRLLETLDAYLEVDLSQRRTAERLGVHPNTVAYRLRRIAEQTGRDLDRPGTCASWPWPSAPCGCGTKRAEGAGRRSASSRQARAPPSTTRV